VSDLAELDLTDAELYRAGFPHALFTRMRREALVWWQAAPEGFAGGRGHHYCLGANLARREIAIPFEELLRRTRRIEVLAPPVSSALGIYSPILVATKELPVRLT
jgi:cytochrome P450